MTIYTLRHYYHIFDMLPSVCLLSVCLVVGVRASVPVCVSASVCAGADTAAGVVATLLELGADVNKDDGDPEVRYTPLHSAVANEVKSWDIIMRH